MKSQRSFCLILFLSTVATGCGLAEKVEEAKAQADALSEEYASFDLACDFEAITAYSEAETDAQLTADDAPADDAAADDTTCDDAEEQFSVLTAEFDSDGDNKISEEELAEAEAGWIEAQIVELDTDGDGTVSDAEKKKWRSEKLPARKETLGQKFKEACSNLSRTETSCKEMRAEHKAQIKEQIAERRPEFDKDGDGTLADEERETMRDAFKGERRERREDFKKENDKDGDGKIAKEEFNQRRTKREETQDQVRRSPPPPAPK